MLQNKTSIQSKSNSKSSNNKSALANNDSDYDEDQFEEVNYSNGLHDYKQQYININNEYTPSHPSDKLKKPSFLSKQSRGKSDYSNFSNNQSSESKLPPSLRWVLEEENWENGEDEFFERNSKANAHLAPIHNSNASLKPQLYKNGSANIAASVGTIYGGTEQQQPIDRIPSIKKLSSQKTRRLQPLRK